MALAETAELAVRLSLDDRMSPAIRKAQGGLRTLGSTAKTVGKGIAVGVGIGAAAGIVALTGAIHSGIEALKEDKVVAAQTAAVIKSTGGAAGVSAQQVADLADKLSVLDGVQDNVVQGAENLLLTFTNIGQNIFPDATAAVLDMAAALGTDANSAAKTLGKALQDPIKGMTALRRVGVILTDAQQAQIKALVKQGDLYGAQKIILGEVEKKYRDVAKAQADADPGRRLQVATERFQKSLASGLLPVIEKVQLRLSEWLSKPETLEMVRKIGDAIGGLFTDQNLNAVASGLEVAAKAVGVAITAFNSLPPEIKALAIGAFAINKVTGGAVGGLAAGFGKVLGAGLQKIFAANVTVIGQNVTGGGGPGGGPGGGNAGKFLLGAAAIASIAAVVATWMETNQASSDQAHGLQQQLKDALPKQTTRQQAQDLAAIRQGIHDIESNPLLVLVQGDALSTLKAMEASLTNRPQNVGGPARNVHRGETLTPGGNGFGAIAQGIASAFRNNTQQVVNATLRNPAYDRISAKITATERQLHRAAESGDNRRTARLQGRLDRLVAKKTSFTVKNAISTYVSVRDIDNSTSYKTKVARSTSLAAR